MRAAIVALMSLTSVGSQAAPLQITCWLESRVLCVKGQECRDVSHEFRLDTLRWNFSLDRAARQGTAERCESNVCAPKFSVDVSPLAYRFWERIGNETFAISPDLTQISHTITNSAEDGGRVLFGFGTCKQ
jgi:hypothetical protein